VIVRTSRRTDSRVGATHPDHSAIQIPSIPSIFMPDALPAATLLIYHGLGQALSCAGFHALWLVFCGIIT